ncbi:RNA ligase/cyclic nucleotide phosphodiesterase [Schizophyllum amplum]|uniref:RNA ligase/cyclic nucleotide phosphodiesterase n=1 Tax=Schizophyllum amplum TaxID=97359 RepID=A0A550C7I6_9AGAR|nr:RNA ligase/cyclic nucleotide phosphodiesterase [Auriculariopsis ampla]
MDGYIKSKSEFLSDGFAGVRVDPILSALDRAQKQGAPQPDIDIRHCLTLIALPPQSVIALAEDIQNRLKAVSPNIWLVPARNLHITLLELVSGKTEADVDAVIQQLGCVSDALVAYPRAHPARLVRPRLNFDFGGLALSFVPDELQDVREGDIASTQTYHHLRRDLYALSLSVGVLPQSRYTLPSAHITIARFISDNDFVRSEHLSRLLRASTASWETSSLGWMVGEAGVELRKGRTWYGGGEAVCRS